MGRCSTLCSCRSALSPVTKTFAFPASAEATMGSSSGSGNEGAGCSIVTKRACERSNFINPAVTASDWPSFQHPARRREDRHGDRLIVLIDRGIAGLDSAVEFDRISRQCVFDLANRCKSRHPMRDHLAGFQRLQRLGRIAFIIGDSPKAA